MSFSRTFVKEFFREITVYVRVEETVRTVKLVMDREWFRSVTRQNRRIEREENDA